MKLSTYLRKTKTKLIDLCEELEHERNWAGRVLSGQRSISLLDALRISEWSGGKVTLRDLREHLAVRNQRAVDFAFKQ